MLVWDHEPLTRSPGAHLFGPRSIGDGLTRLTFRVARCTTARPDLWPSETVEIALQFFMRVDGGPKVPGPGIGRVSTDAFDLFTSGEMTAAELIAAGKLQFGAKGGIRVNARGEEVIEHVTGWDLTGPFVGANRTITAELGIRGGSFATEFTVEVV